MEEKEFLDLMSEKEELVKQYFTKSDIKPKAIEENALEILKMRYFSVKADGNKEENFSELCRRALKIVAAPLSVPRRSVICCSEAKDTRDIPRECPKSLVLNGLCPHVTNR